jgi:hypothetical protein
MSGPMIPASHRPKQTRFYRVGALPILARQTLKVFPASCTDVRPRNRCLVSGPGR